MSELAVETQVPEYNLVKARPLFQDVTQVDLAGVNENKLEVIGEWVGHHAGCHGESLRRLLPNKVSGKEAVWEHAGLVVQDKIERFVSTLKNNFGGIRLIIASDVVVWVNGHALYNLSRKGHMNGEALRQEVDWLKMQMTKPFEVVWDITAAFSRLGKIKGTGLHVGTGVREVVNFRPIEPEAIKQDFWADIPGAMGRNTRIKLIDGYSDHILNMGYVPYAQVAHPDGSFYRNSWREKIQSVPVDEESKRIAQFEIVGGLPIRGNLDAILDMQPTFESNGCWLWV